MCHLIQPLNGTAWCPLTAFPLPPTSSCSLQAKPRWVHVKDHMTIGIPDPVRVWEWIRPNSTMSQALETEWQAFSAWTHTGRTALLWKCHVVWQFLPVVICTDVKMIKIPHVNITKPKRKIGCVRYKEQCNSLSCAVREHLQSPQTAVAVSDGQSNINWHPLSFLSLSPDGYSVLQLNI